MTILVLDSSVIQKLKAVATMVEVRDEQGTLVGHFHPAVTPETVDQYECPLSEGELRRIASKGGGRPLADILDDLRKGS